MAGDGTSQAFETRERVGYLNVWVLVHHRAHGGVEVWPARVETEAALPEPADFIALRHSKLEKDEWAEWRGPFEVKV